MKKKLKVKYVKLNNFLLVISANILAIWRLFKCARSAAIVRTLYILNDTFSLWNTVHITLVMRTFLKTRIVVNICTHVFWFDVRIMYYIHAVSLHRKYNTRV